MLCIAYECIYIIQELLQITDNKRIMNNKEASHLYRAIQHGYMYINIHNCSIQAALEFSIHQHTLVLSSLRIDLAMH